MPSHPPATTTEQTAQSEAPEETTVLRLKGYSEEVRVLELI